MSNDKPENPLVEFLAMTDAQRIASGDQAKAEVHDKLPEMVPILDKANDFLAVLSGAVFDHPKSALLAMLVVEDTFELFRAAIAALEEGELPE